MESSYFRHLRKAQPSIQVYQVYVPQSSPVNPLDQEISLSLNQPQRIVKSELEISVEQQAAAIVEAVDRGVTNFVFPRMLWLILFKLRLPIKRDKAETADKCIQVSQSLCELDSEAVMKVRAKL